MVSKREGRQDHPYEGMGNTCRQRRAFSRPATATVRGASHGYRPHTASELALLSLTQVVLRVS